jgi:hypothetical protein
MSCVSLLAAHYCLCFCRAEKHKNANVFCIKLFSSASAVLEQVYTFPVGRQLLLFRYHKCINEYCFNNNFHSRRDDERQRNVLSTEERLLALFILIISRYFFGLASTINLEHFGDNNNKSKKARRGQAQWMAAHIKTRRGAHSPLAEHNEMETLKQSINSESITEK